MNFYNDLVCFLNGLDDFFIEVEGKPDKLTVFINEYNQLTNSSITMQTDGIRILGENVDKWGLEFRLYTNVRPQSPLNNEFHSNRTYRTEYSFRCNNNSLIKPLLFNGFYLGRNRGAL